MNKLYETYHLEWQGYLIEVRYCSSWSPSYEEIYGEPLAHLEIILPEEPRRPLPVTETGYRSHFIPAKVIEGAGGAVAFVRGWLDEAAKSPAWKGQQAAARQFLLL